MGLLIKRALDIPRPSVSNQTKGLSSLPRMWYLLLSANAENSGIVRMISLGKPSLACKHWLPPVANGPDLAKEGKAGVHACLARLAWLCDGVKVIPVDGRLRVLSVYMFHMGGVACLPVPLLEEGLGLKMMCHDCVTMLDMVHCSATAAYAHCERRERR